MGTRLVSQKKGDMRYGTASPFYLTPQKRLPIEYSPWDAPCASTLRCPLAHIHVRTCSNGHSTGSAQEALRGVQAV
jgi:hypothetical protein